MITIQRYRRPDGFVPFDDWFDKLRDRAARSRIMERIYRMQEGNFGDRVAVGEGVFELRIHSGSGFRVYYGQHGGELVLLLCGGSKKSQAADIGTARGYWREWKMRPR